MRKVQNESLLLSVFMVALFIFSHCDPRGSNRETIENDNSYEMLEGEDIDPGEDTIRDNENEVPLDSTELSDMKRLQDQSVKYQHLLDSISKQNPNLTYTYVPTQDGRIKTVLGDYKVSIDNTRTPEEQNTIGVIIEKMFNNRQQMLEYYNKLQNVDLPAKPKEGYPEFYEELKSYLDYPEEVESLDAEGLLFVQLAIEKDGTVSNVKVAENVNMADDDVEEAIEQAAIEAIKKTSGKWNAAQKDGKPVRSKLEIPIWFDTNLSS